uniref:Acyl-CoA desaturase 1-like n=1 Tax=Peromyscus maniculatus bairdii TaxID=230844 RepID=A0A8C8TJZ4_PERMB
MTTTTTTTTITKPLSGGLENEGEKLEKIFQQWGEDIRPEMKEDIHDPSYQDEEGPPPKLEYVWRNIILMALLHLGALYGITLVPSCKVYTWIFVYVSYIVTGLSITAGAHRLWSHRTYKARLPLRLFLIIANTMAFQNDVYEWARDHRAHHKFTETHADPHDSRRGFFFSHVGWLLVRKHPAVKEKGGKLDMSDLKAEKLVMFQRRYYKPGLLLMCFILPTLVPWYFWGETFQHSFYVAALLRYALVLNGTWLVNSAAHLYGYRPYDRNIGARQNMLTSMGALGKASTTTTTPSPTTTLPVSTAGTSTSPRSSSTAWLPWAWLMTGRKCPRPLSWPGSKELEMGATRVAEFLFQMSLGQKVNVLLMTIENATRMLKMTLTHQAVVAHACNPSTQEAEAGGSL